MPNLWPIGVDCISIPSFFIDNNGQYKKISPKPPRLDALQMKERVAWAKGMSAKLNCDDYHYCFLDEKWFYCHSNRKKYIILPLNYDINETMEDAYVAIPRVQSRHNPCKVMFMGIVVAPPNIDKKFDGKIYMKHVNDYVKQQTTSHI